jgi:hypothetical protein
MSGLPVPCRKSAPDHLMNPGRRARGRRCSATRIFSAQFSKAPAVIVWRRRRAGSGASPQRSLLVAGSPSWLEAANGVVAGGRATRYSGGGVVAVARGGAWAAVGDVGENDRAGSLKRRAGFPFQPAGTRPASAAPSRRCCCLAGGRCRFNQSVAANLNSADTDLSRLAASACSSDLSAIGHWKFTVHSAVSPTCRRFIAARPPVNIVRR